MFRPEIAAAMAAYFSMRAPENKLTDLALMRLMVLSERACMAQTTSLLCGSGFASTPHGPALSEVLDLMTGRIVSSAWDRCIGYVPHGAWGTPSNYCCLKQNVDAAETLSEFEIDLLECVWKQFGEKSRWEVADIRREFPEWDSACAETQTSRPISFQSVFELGLQESQQAAAERANELEYFEAVAA